VVVVHTAQEFVKRLGTLAAGSALLTLSYYVWLIGGYLNEPYMVAEWIMMLAAGLLISYSLAAEHFRTPALFEGWKGVVTAALCFTFGVYITRVQGFSQPGFLLVEGFVFIFSLLVSVNALRPELLARPRSVHTFAAVGFAALSGVLALFSLRFGATYAAFFVASAFLGVLLIVGRKRFHLCFLLLISETALFGYILSKVIPAYATDEFAIDAYAARLFLHGLNPYSQPTLGHALGFYGLSSYYETPLSSGGYVNWLSYPSLSFLALVPAVALGVQARAVLVLFTLASLTLVYARYKTYGPVALVAVLIVLIDASVLYFPVGSVPDMLWALPLALSLVFKRRTRVSGALYGVSLSAKQIPAVILPFLSYSAYRKGGPKRLAGFLGSAAISFLALNAPFIMTAPRAWLGDVVSPLGAPLIGGGQGLSEISFLGYLTLSRWYFLFMEALAALVLFAVYTKSYTKYRHSFLGFPILVFFFGYRFLFNYVVYWPLLALVELPEVMKDSVSVKKGRSSPLRAEAVALIVLVVSGGGAGALLHYDPPLRVYSVGAYADPLAMPGFVTSMRVNVTYANGTNFRIFDSDMMNSVNGLVWRVVNVTGSGNWRLYTIEPLTPSLALPAGTHFEVEAYTASYHAYYGVQTSPELPVPAIANPGLYSYGGSIPGWSFVTDTQGGRATEKVLAQGVTLSVTKWKKGWVSAELSQRVNLTAVLPYTLGYTLSGEGSVVGADGNPLQAVGLEFASGPYEVWYLYSQLESGVYMPNAHTLVFLSSSTSVELAGVYYDLLDLGWMPSEPLYLLLVVGLQTGNGSFSATFSGLNLSA
jgi:uncharacterized membrane protein